MLAIAAAVLVVLISVVAMLGFGRNHFDPKDKFCYITGGSAGLGKCLAADLVRRGAHVVIVARGAKRAEETVAELKALASPSQKIFYLTADMSDRLDSAAALEKAAAGFGGRAPDYVFLCAGMARPRLFVDATPEQLREGLDGVYWVSAWTAHAAVKMMVRQKAKGSITFVASFLGYTSFAGYSTYAPGKFAIRGLADSLRSELQLYGIDVHLYMPSGMLSPGYEEENLTKPAITQKIEQGDKPITCDAAAAILVRGLQRGNYQITNDFAAELVRCSSNGPVPSNGPFDYVLLFIGAIGLPFWRMFTDRDVRIAGKAHAADLASRGFYAAPAPNS